MITHLNHEESGAVLVMFTIMLVVLLGFAAMAVDTAAAWAQRRLNQAAVDTGAIAGGLLITTKPPNVAINDATDEVIRITYQTLDPDQTESQWRAEWVTCTDPGRPAAYTLEGISQCISFTADLTRIRVVLPTIDVPTSFGSVLGRDFISTGAVAEAGINAAFGGGVLPFGLPGAVAEDTEVCLKTGSNPSGVSPCDGPDSGNFAFLDITQFGSVAGGTTRDCTGGTKDRLARNIMQGADHFLGVAITSGSTPIVDRTMCTIGAVAAEPNTIATETGNMTGVLHEGLVLGDTSGGIPGRLAQGTNSTPVAGWNLDDTPLWDFLNDAGDELCGWPTTRSEIVSCLDAWHADDGVIFDESITDAPRWAWVPLFWESALGPGSTDRTVREYRPVYLQTTLWKCQATSCAIVFDPGESLGGTGGGGNQQIEAISGIQIPLGALPAEIRSAQPGTAGAKQFDLLK